MSICTRLLGEEFDGKAKVADDAGEVVANEDVFALEVSVSDGRFLGDSVHYSLVVEVSQTYSNTVHIFIHVYAIYGCGVGTDTQFWRTQKDTLYLCISIPTRIFVYLTNLFSNHNQHI